MQSKPEIRQQILSQRDALAPQEIRRRSEAACSRLIALPEYITADTVMFFIAFGSEVETLPLVRQALEANYQVLAPRVNPLTKMIEPCLLRSVKNDLAAGYYGILEPLPHCPVIAADEIDVILVPAVAWDKQGYRVGYGGGFYDRFLETARNAVWVGLGFELQVLARVPHNPQDLPVDILVTDEQVRRFANRR